MWKWLRSWFACRFSLRRLVVAVVFLGVFVGLNVVRPPTQLVGLDAGGGERVYKVVGNWGWPLPVTLRLDDPPPTRMWDPLTAWDASKALTEEQFYQGEWLPWTYQTYHLSFRCRWINTWYWRDKASPQILYFLPAIIDLIFAVVVLALLLFLQIPRRKVAAKVELATPAARS